MAISNYHQNHKLNCVLDLDNSVISSLSLDELKTIRGIETRDLDHITMPGQYRIYMRPHLDEFIEYVFSNFNVTIWTAASREYAEFIVDKIILKNANGKALKLFLYDKNCAESQALYKNDSPKDLRYLYHFTGYHPCNTFIIDDLHDVYKANPKQTLRAPYFDASKKSSESDSFLLDAITTLRHISAKHALIGCKNIH